MAAGGAAAVGGGPALRATKSYRHTSQNLASDMRGSPQTGHPPLVPPVAFEAVGVARAEATPGPAGDAAIATPHTEQ